MSRNPKEIAQHAWDGNLAIRRYAVFSGMFGDYMIVVRGEFDLAHAEKWGGFVKWIGGVRQAEQRVVKKPNSVITSSPEDGGVSDANDT